MASIGVVNANIPNTQAPMETTERLRKIYFGVFFDGTSNNMIQKAAAKKYKKENQKKSEDWEAELISIEDDAFKNGANQTNVEGAEYSNVAILHSVYQAMSIEDLQKEKQASDVYIYNIYIEGAGTEAIYSGNWWEKGTNAAGSVAGRGSSGVSKLVAKAVNMVRLRLNGYRYSELQNTELHFDVFGFSRGATCARLFSYLVVRGGNDTLGCEEDFEDSAAAKYYMNGYLHFLDRLPLKSATVDFLGIYDTVSSIGGITTESYANNTTDYGLYSPSLAKVKNTFHLCAMDEFRAHFALTDIGSGATMNGNAEILIPGCHSDVGGGYVTGDNNFTLTKFARPPLLTLPMDYIDKKPSYTSPLTQQTLLEMGWISEKDSYRESFDHTTVSVRRYVNCGYSNIPLKMMSLRAEMKTSRATFNTIPIRYKIDTKTFGTWSKPLLEKAKSSTGKDIYYPGGGYTSASYVTLRQYLHFSSKDDLGFDPSYDGFMFARYLYHGNKGDSTRHFLHER